MEIGKVILGNVMFFLGYFGVVVLERILPTIIALISGFGSNLEGLVWAGTFIIWVILMIIAPIGTMIYGLLTNQQESNNFMDGTIGILYGLLSIIIAWTSWYMMDGLISIATFGITTVLFWVGLACLYAMNCAVIPIYVIVKSRQ